MNHSSKVTISMLVFATVCSSTALADRIRLSTGEILEVRIVERGAETIRIVHPVLGELTLPNTAVEVMPTEPANAPVVEREQATAQADSGAASQPASSQPAAPTNEQAAQPEREWKFRLTLAGASASGNTESTNVSGIFSAFRETPQIKTAIDASYFYGQSNGDTSENRFSTGFRHDWLNPGSEWFSFLHGRYDRDQFQSWDHRAQGHFGLGHHLIEPPKLRLDLLAGLGAVKEWGSSNDNVRPEGLLGVDGEFTIADRHTIIFASTVFPDLASIADFRWVNTAAWAWTIDMSSDLALTAGLQHEYQSQVDSGRDRNDLRIYAGLQLDF